MTDMIPNPASSDEWNWIPAPQPGITPDEHDALPLVNRSRMPAWVEELKHDD